MHVGISIRNMGVESVPELLRHCAVEAERADLHSIWLHDHIAIPPDEAEGSGGRYLDPLATLAWLGGQTSRILLGVGVLILPYRPQLPVAKWIATVQELTGERLILGVGIGWMQAEFNAVNVALKNRVRISEQTLEFLHRCFASDIVRENGQEFIFKPRPARPLILIGGAAPHATDRALSFGDGWLPMGNDPDKLAPSIRDYRNQAKAQGKPSHVYAFGGLGDDRTCAQEKLARLEEIGVDAVITSVGYTDKTSFSKNLDALLARIN